MGCHARRLIAREWARNEHSGCSIDAIDDACGDLSLVDALPLEALVEGEDDRREFALHATMTPLDPAAVMIDVSS